MLVEDERERTTEQLGSTKTGGNYAASLLPIARAQADGYDNIIWLDACERKYVEEVGTSNIFFFIDDKLITPPLSGSILGGITRNSVIKLAQSWDIEAEERPVAIDEVIEASKNGSLQESFATGTAAVISPVGELMYGDRSYPINNGETGPLSIRLYEELQAIQYGHREDQYGWRVKVG